MYSHRDHLTNHFIIIKKFEKLKKLQNLQTIYFKKFNILNFINFDILSSHLIN